MHEQARCSSAEELFDALRPNLSDEGAAERYVYRGLGNADYSLLPTALRSLGSLGIEPVIREEINVFSDFVRALNSSGYPIPGYERLEQVQQELRNLASAYLPRDLGMWPRREHLDIWAIGQHHGLPTRLLDWSFSPLVAMYFAAASAVRQELKVEEMAVWRLDRTALDGDSHVGVCEISAARSPNLAAQSGLFTVTYQRTGYTDTEINASPIEALIPPTPKAGRPPLVCYRLPITFASRVLEFCRICGAHPGALFPGFEGATRAAIDHAAARRRQRTSSAAR